MEHIYILNVFTDITALYMIIIQIRHGHNHHVRIHFHHQCNQLFFTDIISPDPVVCFCLLKYRIGRIACDIMNRQQILDNIFKIFVKTIIFRVKNQMLIGYREKSPVVRFFPRRIGVMPGLFSAAAYIFQLCQLSAAFLQSD